MQHSVRSLNIAVGVAKHAGRRGRLRVRDGLFWLGSLVVFGRRSESARARRSGGGIKKVCLPYIEAQDGRVTGSLAWVGQPAVVMKL